MIGYLEIYNSDLVYSSMSFSSEGHIGLFWFNYLENLILSF